jgi:hypothetical protein
MALSSYRDLEVWQKAMQLIVESYRCTSSFPADERFGLTAQIRRAAVSVAANIAEGQNLSPPSISVTRGVATSWPCTFCAMRSAGC